MLRIMIGALLNLSSMVFAQNAIGERIVTRYPAEQKIENEVIQVIPAGVVLTVQKSYHDGRHQWFWVRYQNLNGWVWSQHANRLTYRPGSVWRPRADVGSVQDADPIHVPSPVNSGQPSIISTGGIYVPTSPNSGFDSNGNHYTVSGNVAIGSHGVTYTLSGDVGIGSDGSVVYGNFGQ